MLVGIFTLPVMSVLVIKGLDCFKQGDVLGMLMRPLGGQAVIFTSVTFTALAA